VVEIFSSKLVGYWAPLFTPFHETSLICLQEPAFQRLIFITMHAWENPYRKENDSEKASFQVFFFQIPFILK
jgi:hypothetical protein